MSKKVTVRTEECDRVHIPLEEAGVKDLGLKCDTCGGRDAPVSYTHLTLPTTPYV